jgi:DNA repair exonuclease SbcCD nuclease subunit
MKIAVVGDLHWGARNDNQEFLNYFQRFFDNVFFPELEERGVNQVLQVGDFVDRRKFISFVTLNHVREKIFGESHKRGISWDILVGNHDTPYKNTNEINSLQELFSQYRGIRFYPDPTEINLDGLDVLLLPWINASNHAKSMKAISETKAQIAFGHLEINGFEMHPGAVCDHGIEASLFNKFDMVCSGHFHKRSSSSNIFYLGTPYQIMWTDYNQEKGFYIFDTDTRELEFIPNPYTLFHKVWYDDAGKTLEKILASDLGHLNKSYVKVIVKNKENPYWFDLFMNKIYNIAPIDVSIVDDHYHLDEISEEDLVSEAEDTLTILSKYINELEYSVDKKKLDNLMRELYNESLALETIHD